ncbi:hypothetical protein R4B61_00470 [Fructilactobacillus vespulae]|uniref:hypothetical protein n=1 Tax=Fructilactobacillus vespulae TaxID=1249630 RepID=UPI0039B44B0B
MSTKPSIELTGSEAGTTIKFAYELENVKQGTTNIDELTKVGKCIKAKIDEKKAGK